MAGRHLGPIEVERIFLYEENPRHEPMGTQEEIIEYLCKEEQVFNLARSIAEAGTNPLDLTGVVEDENSKKGIGKKAYQVWEGNRRICAIQLLNDPDKAPPDLRDDFAALVKETGYKPILKIMCVNFDNHDDLKFWMQILHGGQQDGIGRKNWDSQQKERHVGSGRNKVALAVLDTAERLGLISAEERGGKLTTVQRYLNSSVVKEALGVDARNKDDVTYTRPLDDLTKQLGRFISDLKKGKVHSRANKDHADAYGRQLARSTDISGERTQPLSLSTISGRKIKGAVGRRKKPKKKDHLGYDKGLATAFENLQNDKLESLYYSITSIKLENHTPLLTVGVWSLVECVSALAGRNGSTDFVAFYSKDKLAGLGFASGKMTSLRAALSRISEGGNSTKHHETAASFDGKQLANDLVTITPIMLKTLDSMAPKK